MSLAGCHNLPIPSREQTDVTGHDPILYRSSSIANNESAGFEDVAVRTKYRFDL